MVELALRPSRVAVAKRFIVIIMGGITLIAAVFQAPRGYAESATYRIDPAKSRATIHVGKAGAFSFIAGHTHEVSGPIQSGSVVFDRDAPSGSRVQLVIETHALRVSPTGEPKGDAPKAQEAMESDKVLDVAHYPRITFDSTAVTLKGARGDALDVAVAGRLAIRGATQTISVPVHVELAGAMLTATGQFAIKQTTFGIKPISVGGVVAVKDTLEIGFSISADK